MDRSTDPLSHLSDLWSRRWLCCCVRLVSGALLLRRRRTTWRRSHA